MTEGKLELLQKQINAKVYWGARDREVLDWLKEKKGIEGDKANEMLIIAARARERSIRKHAILRLCFSAMGLAIAGGFYALQFWGGLYVIGLGSFLLIGVGIVSFATFVDSLWRLISGRVSGPIDD